MTFTINLPIFLSHGHFVSENGLIKIKPVAEHLQKLQAFNGKKVSLGIRPERFESGGQDNDIFKARIDVIEMLGKEKILYVHLEDDSELIISMPGHYEYYSGEEHSFAFDLTALHYFDSETGDRIN